jgi:hypothetical protein
MSDDSQPLLPGDDHVIETLRAELERVEPSKRGRILEKFVLAVLSSIPWAGGVLSAAESYRNEGAAVRQNSLQNQWLGEHQRKIVILMTTLQEIQTRFENIGEDIDERLQSEEYLALVRKAFRIWDQADTEEKRRLLANTVTNAASTRACSDDVIRLFLDWIENYNEVHFAVIKEIIKNPGSTRFEIWSNLYGEIPREDSAEADLFKFLIRELNLGEVIRQERDVNQLGQYIRRRSPQKRRGPAPATLDSAFEDTKPYVLAGIGKQFVHYTMNEIVTRLEADTDPSL